MNIEKAMELRQAQKQFWANWKKIAAATVAKNAQNETNYSWQHYAGLEGVGNPSIYPEATNYEIARFIIEGAEPSEEILYIF